MRPTLRLPGKNRRRMSKPHPSVICASCGQRSTCRKLWEANAHCEHWAIDESPGIVTLAARAGKETARWISAGAKITPSDVQDQRLAICQACPHWNPEAYMGTGSCEHPSCHCTRAKLAYATSKCPMGKWLAHSTN